MVRAFKPALLTLLLVLPLSGKAMDTALVGHELMARCEGTPELKKADQLYCKGYLEALEDWAADARAHSGAAPFCVPPEGVSDEQLRLAFVSWGKANVSELRQSALKTALAALAATYPCTN